MKHILISLVTMLTFNGCQNPTGVYSFLARKQMSNITIIGFQSKECANGDVYRAEIIATDKNGKRVEGSVCSTLLGRPKLVLK